MIVSVVGSGGKTTLIKKLADRYRREGKTVFVTTTTHMFIEEDTLLSDDADAILHRLKEKGYAMAGIPEGGKIKALSQETYEAVCSVADVVLVEADGSKRLPLKYPNESEPVIPENTEEILVVCGLNGLGQQAKKVCHRLELVKECLGIEDETIITAAHIQKLVTDGYLRPLRAAYPNAKITLAPRHDGTLYQRALTALLRAEMDVSLIRKEWFFPLPKMETTEPGMLCVITENHGTAPTGVGSMMFVGKDAVLGSIGGGEPEERVIRHARENPCFSVVEPARNSREENGPDRICEATMKVACIPVD